MKTVSIVCDLCGSPCLEGWSVITCPAGAIRDQLPDEVHACKVCGQRLLDFLRSGRPELSGSLPKDLTPAA